MVLFEVVIPKKTFKFGAKNFNFIRVRLGEVGLCYVNLYVTSATNERHICDQHLKLSHYQHNLVLNEVAYFSLIFTNSP